VMALLWCIPYACELVIRVRWDLLVAVGSAWC
jgi:hypothetical protein